MKLKSITLNGFKSFADKTTLTFHDGLTAVVGPNGCGKSNIVDAFKWVMGEQSAKSLRGGEMMDVIFNGTASRRSGGFAEVSLCFEDFCFANPAQMQAVLAPELPAADAQASEAQAPEGAAAESPADQDPADAPAAKAPAADSQPDQGQYVPVKAASVPMISSGDTITITRRLYRNGESEYLINNKAARLRDIREMFMDTGAGVDAYSLIEQGRVEGFLQASAADRRGLFDEAAGISKYKARKKEALRKLERVDQNLLRVTDILAEVEKRLRSIKVQAGKARNYQQYSTQLTELRSLFSLAEYHRLSHQRRELQDQVGHLTDQLAGLSTQIGQLEAARSASETELTDLEHAARTLEGQIAGVNGQIATCQQRVEMLLSRAKELSDSAASDASKCEQLEARAEAARQDAQSLTQDISALDAELVSLSQRDEQARDNAAVAAQEAQQVRRQLDDEKNGTIDMLRRVSQLHNEINSQSMRRENFSAQQQRLQGRSGELTKRLEDLLAKRAGLATRAEEIASVIAALAQRQEETQQQSRQVQQAEQQAGDELSRSQQAHSALLSRQGVLAEMQRKLEGVGAGVRNVLLAAREGKWPTVRGILGQFINTDVEHAVLIETALQEYEQQVLVDSLDSLASNLPGLKELLRGDGVQFLCLDRIVSASSDASALPSDPAIIGRASEWVQCDEFLRPAVEAILGKTLIVNELSDAIRIASTIGSEWRFVTRAGEVLGSQGQLRVGRGKNSIGVISRRSELADLERRIEESQQRIEEQKARRSQLQAERAHLEQTTTSLRNGLYEANGQRVQAASELKQVDESAAQVRKELPLLEGEVRQLTGEIEQAVRKEHEAQQKAAELEELKSQRETQIAALQQQCDQAVGRQQALNIEITAARVALAEARQKRQSIQERVANLTRQAESMQQELTALRQQIEQHHQRKAEAQSGAAEAQQQIEALVTQKGELARDAAETAESITGLQNRLAGIRECIAAQRKGHDDMAGQSNALRVQLSEVEVRIESLITRTSEELSLDLPAAYGQYTHDSTRDWEAVRQEIADLRGKIERLGNVNLDAIAEHEELQQRETFLTGQLEDIRESQRQLAELIKRINVESKRRFEESFQTVRGHFHELFRKLFGGGKADILLTNPEDPLDSDIEILARPPGKDLKSITLLSGGEKTMTALALLFSFFKARPSPFCLLDEVDAALDEANTGRFTQLVQEFMTISQFVVVSHSKRTMSMAQHIYGITMQDPGVSSLISVRFEEAQQFAEQGQAVGA